MLLAVVVGAIGSRDDRTVVVRWTELLALPASRALRKAALASILPDCQRETKETKAEGGGRDVKGSKD